LCNLIFCRNLKDLYKDQDKIYEIKITYRLKILSLYYLIKNNIKLYNIMNRNIEEIPAQILDKINALDQDDIVFLRNMNPNTQLTSNIEEKLLDLNNRLGNDMEVVSRILKRLSLKELKKIKDTSINSGPPVLLTLYTRKIFVLLGLIIALYGFFVSYHLFVDNARASYIYLIPLLFFFTGVVYSSRFILEI